MSFCCQQQSRHFRDCQQQQQSDESSGDAEPSLLQTHFIVPTNADPSKYSNNSNDTNTTPKPKRPLTSYHIYFQLEREYIIQTMEVEDADNKSTMHDDDKEDQAISRMVLCSW